MHGNLPQPGRTVACNLRLSITFKPNEASCAGCTHAKLKEAGLAEDATADTLRLLQARQKIKKQKGGLHLPFNSDLRVWAFASSYDPILFDFSERTRRLSVNGHRVLSTISFLISLIALAGFSPFGQVLAQFMMVWQR